MNDLIAEEKIAVVIRTERGRDGESQALGHTGSHLKELLEATPARLTLPCAAAPAFRRFTRVEGKEETKTDSNHGAVARQRRSELWNASRLGPSEDSSQSLAPNREP
jgi:hypothetical protein